MRLEVHCVCTESPFCQAVTELCPPAFIAKYNTSTSFSQGEIIFTFELQDKELSQVPGRQRKILSGQFGGVSEISRSWVN